jgi:hypothetical protein
MLHEVHLCSISNFHLSYLSDDGNIHWQPSQPPWKNPFFVIHNRCPLSIDINSATNFSFSLAAKHFPSLFNFFTLAIALHVVHVSLEGLAHMHPCSHLMARPIWLFSITVEIHMFHIFGQNQWLKALSSPSLQHMSQPQSKPTPTSLPIWAF